MEPQVQYCKTSDGVNIAFGVAGSGPPLVYARTWSASHVQLDWQQELPGKLYEALAARRTLITFDRRGAGLSDRGVSELTLEKLTLEKLTLDLESVVDHLGLERFALMGFRFGMMVSTIYALCHPERVSGLISLNGVMNGSAFWQWPRIRALRAMREADFDTFVETMASINRDPHMSGISRASITPEGHKAFIDASETFDVTDLVPQLKLPVLLLYPADGPSAAAEGALAREMATRIPGARLVAVPGEPREANAERVASAVDTFLSDAPAPPSPAPGVVHTVLFTDIVGHTEMMQRLGDEHGREVLREHERITRETLKQHGGAEVKTDGDSFMASFASVSAAVECAVALQRAFGQHSETTGEPIVVRMGLNVGEPIEEDGDYFGSAVILGARIKDQAGGGEILVPEAVRHLLSGKPFLFSDRGEVALKGFEDAVRLYEVRWRDGTR